MTALNPAARIDAAPPPLPLLEETADVMTASASAPPEAQCTIISEGESAFEGDVDSVPGAKVSVKPCTCSIDSKELEDDDDDDDDV